MSSVSSDKGGMWPWAGPPPHKKSPQGLLCTEQPVGEGQGLRSGLSGPCDLHENLPSSLSSCLFLPHSCSPWPLPPPHPTPPHPTPPCHTPAGEGCPSAWMFLPGVLRALAHAFRAPQPFWLGTATPTKPLRPSGCSAASFSPPPPRCTQAPLHRVLCALPIVPPGLQRGRHVVGAHLEVK